MFLFLFCVWFKMCSTSTTHVENSKFCISLKVLRCKFIISLLSNISKYTRHHEKENSLTPYYMSTVHTNIYKSCIVFVYIVHLICQTSDDNILLLQIMLIITGIYVYRPMYGCAMHACLCCVHRTCYLTIKG